MFLNFQNDDECFKTEAQFQYMVGENLLVAPVLSEKENFKKLYLPEGNWLDWWTNKTFEGIQWVIVEVPANKIPLFVKEGGIIPMQEEQNYVAEKKIEELELRIFPTDSSAYVLYEDDGITTNYKNGLFAMTKFEVIKNGESITVNVSKENDKYKTGRKNYIFKLYNSSIPKSISLNSKELKFFGSIPNLISSEEGYGYNEDGMMIIIKVKDTKEINILIKE